ncbi:MAG: type III secretion system export apparatus subunit SctU [Myxococcota bacterium]|nr:type III secretion system export apparatus subunit SctU [Myxococcota bacterium]
MSESSGEKTEEPTQKKIDDSRKKGQVWKSKDLAAVGVFVAGMGSLRVLWPALEEQSAELFRFAFEQLANPEDLPKATTAILFMALKTVVLLTVPFALGCAILAGLLEFLQVGALFAPDAIKPKLDKLNPVGGLKNMFSKKQAVELLKNLFKLSITGYVVFGTVRDSMGLVVSSIRGTETAVLLVMGELLTRIAIKVSLLLMVFAIFDVWWQRRSFMKDLMMTKDEVKREYKESEGDPQHKSARKQLHHEILEGAQMEAVKGADVIVTNPDHVAVALRYDRGSDQAPRLLCKGIDARAEAIKALAKEHQVAILRNIPLAHALLRVEVGEDIPEALYDAVAEVLTFVYGLKQGETGGKAGIGTGQAA